MKDSKKNDQWILIAAIPVAGIVIFLLAMFPPTITSSPATNSQPDPPLTTEASNASDQDITDERFGAVAAIFEKQGATVIRDPDARNTIRVTVPQSVALGMTKQEAQEMAQSARSRLGENAIVYIKSPSGNTIGKAASWGVE